MILEFVVWRLDFLYLNIWYKIVLPFYLVRFSDHFILVFVTHNFAISFWWRPELCIKYNVKKNMLVKKQILIISKLIFFNSCSREVYRQIVTTGNLNTDSLVNCSGKECWKTFIKCNDVIRNKVFFSIR